MKLISQNPNRCDDWWENYLDDHAHRLDDNWMVLNVFGAILLGEQSPRPFVSEAILSDKELLELLSCCRKNFLTWDSKDGEPIVYGDCGFFKPGTLYEDNGYECQFYVSSRDELWLVSGELEWVGDSPCRSYWNPHQSSLEVADIHNADKEVQRVIRRIEASEMTE